MGSVLVRTNSNLQEESSTKNQLSNHLNMNESDEKTCGDFQENTWLYRSGRFGNGAVGLHNFGVTCCINSVLQTFYMTKEFAHILERFQFLGTGEKEANTPHQLRNLFDMMQRSKEPNIRPRAFINCLKKNGINDYIQHDAEELFLKFLNLLNSQMQNQALAKEITDLYTIRVYEYQQCLQCSAELKNDSYMYSLPVSIVNCRTVEDSLIHFFDFETLTGRNMYLCKNCNVDTEKTQGFLLKSLPPILNLNLKRYSIDRRWFRTMKISNTCEFAEHLDFSKVLSADKLSECTEKQNELQYELFAVVAHSGYSAFYGHYYACIKIHTKWYKFDDSHVSETSWKDVRNTFGGSYYCSTAYMLLYRKCPTSPSGTVS
ncbi:ubl carboxyl-terminal hydrolase 18 [Protopterus annectens]|uniref:ubl carboxyl-terminal hydrolase 18 n=1 Tax=Protopterus annectens TaxID=7888 RepID=UPI001CF947F3|nr:ubl carboxyl-terminal hydrolase 18 [Protopterus annectens]